MQNFVVVSHVRACKRSQKFGGRWGSDLLGLGAVDYPLETCFSPPVLLCQFRPLWVKPYERNYGDPP